MKTRQQLIEARRLWYVRKDCDTETHLHECGSKSACLAWIKKQGCWRAYKKGEYRIGYILWEAES